MAVISSGTAPKTAPCLKKLSKEEFKEFVCELLDREEHPKVYKKQVEGKDYIDVAEVMVSVFSEVYVLQVAVEVLKEANFNNYAIDLGKSFSLFINSISFMDRRCSCLCKMSKEFVEKNKKKLMAKTTEANALLDVLHHNKVLDDHSYCKMKALSSDKKKMKKLLTGAYLASETACDTFCDFLFSTQPHLVANLLNY
uniref:Pyrin domain-containing protein n=1 Tax=Oryzias melastigma TaxID=30732 RepID=A0A3B3CM56_ORYME